MTASSSCSSRNNFRFFFFFYLSFNKLILSKLCRRHFHLILIDQTHILKSIFFVLLNFFFFLFSSKKTASRQIGKSCVWSHTHICSVRCRLLCLLLFCWSFLKSCIEYQSFRNSSQRILLLAFTHRGHEQALMNAHIYIHTSLLFIISLYFFLFLHSYQAFISVFLRAGVLTLGTWPLPRMRRLTNDQKSRNFVAGIGSFLVAHTYILE